MAQEEKKERIRLAVECTPEERKCIKIFAALEDKSINDFVLSCVWKYAKCAKSHVPNQWIICLKVDGKAVENVILKTIGC